jgi:hypothetical protein
VVCATSWKFFFFFGCAMMVETLFASGVGNVSSRLGTVLGHRVNSSLGNRLLLLFWLYHDSFVLLVCLVFPLSGRVVQEEALSAVTSAPELPHNKTRCFKKNDSRVDFSLEYNFLS